MIYLPILCLDSRVGKRGTGMGKKCIAFLFCIKSAIQIKIDRLLDKISESSVKKNLSITV